MKLLIAISTCYDFEKNGNNQVLRETWLPDAVRFCDVRFFFGRGQGAEDQRVCDDGWIIPDKVGLANQGNIFLPEVEEAKHGNIFLPDVDDGYGDLSKKTQHSLRWAHERGYDFVFRCFPDTYCRPERLIACGFENFDYYGDFRGEQCRPDNYPSGGPGYFLSRRAYELLLDAPIEGVHRVSVYAEDLWVGQILNRHRDKGLKYFDDPRFVNHGTRAAGPLKHNSLISTHLSCPDRYNPDRMREKHAEWLASL